MMQTRAIWATVIGAAVGGLVGFLFFSHEGRAFRSNVEPAVDDLSRELRSFRRTVEKAASVASQGYELLNDAMGFAGPQTNERVTH